LDWIQNENWCKEKKMNCAKCISPTECDGTDCLDNIRPVIDQPLVYRLKKRAQIRRQIPGRLAVTEGKPDKIADLLDEAATEIEWLRYQYEKLLKEKSNLEAKMESK
jgi:hypothetical protein